MATPKVSLTGSIAPDAGLTPVLISTQPYSNFPASATTYVYLQSVLTRYAKRRMLTLVNTMNQGVTGVSAGVADFAAALIADASLHLYNSGGGDTGYSIGKAPAVGGGGTFAPFNSANNPVLGAVGDSLIIGITMGATAPTSGNLYFVLGEVV